MHDPLSAPVLCDKTYQAMEFAITAWFALPG
jgi:hypothetical protein